MSERLVLRALDHVSSWCASDAAALQQLSAASNVLWRASLLARAAEPDGARLLGALPPFPRLAPRLLRAHVGVALSLLAGLAPSFGAVGELQVAAERLAGVAGEVLTQQNLESLFGCAVSPADAGGFVPAGTGGLQPRAIIRAS